MGFIPLVFGVAVVLAQPEQTAEEDFRLQVRRLVEQLKSDRFDQRESARAELITLGPAVLPHLPKIHAGTDSELREAISKVRSALEVEAARNSLNARRVNLDVTDKPLLQVLNDITRQTGNPIIDFRGFRGQPKTSPPVTVHWKDVPFWKAVDEVLAKAGMAVYPYAIDREGAPLRAVAFVDRAGQAAGDDKVVAYEGAFRFEPLQVIARRGLRDPLQSGLEVTMEVAWEPRLVPISLKVLYDSLSAVDDTDQQLVLVAAGEREIEMNGGSVGTFPVRFKLPRQSAVKVKMMSGKIEGLIPGGQETFTFNKLTTAKNQQQQKAGATVILEGVRNLGAADDNIEEDGIEEDGIEEDGFGED
ncbi:MAG TPA: hypothetical protein VMX74_15950, partial [Pirellulales bacterium]|nr:hypothetical protein [Pirellulales bacterium]